MPVTAPHIPPADRLAIATLGHTPHAGRWRNEALRTHATPRLLIFSKGQGRMSLAGKTRGLGPNNLVFLPAGTLYGVETGATGFAQIITIPGAMAADWPDEPCHLRLRDVAAQKDLAILLDQLERELLSREPHADRAALHRLALLAVFLDRQIARSDDGGSVAGTTSAERLVEAYTGLIARNFRTPEGVGDYAGALGVTPTHLSRCCRQVSGRAALSLLLDRRMFEARRLLRNSRLPVGQIARDVGFGSAAYFTRAFQKAEGMTPTQFRAKGPVTVH